MGVLRVSLSRSVTEGIRESVCASVRREYGPVSRCARGSESASECLFPWGLWAEETVAPAKVQEQVWPGFQRRVWGSSG